MDLWSKFATRVSQGSALGATLLAEQLSSSVRILPLISGESGIKPRQYSPQFLERGVPLSQDDRDVQDLAGEHGIAAATIYPR